MREVSYNENIRSYMLQRICQILIEMIQYLINVDRARDGNEMAIINMKSSPQHEAGCVIEFTDQHSHIITKDWQLFSIVISVNSVSNYKTRRSIADCRKNILYSQVVDSFSIH